MATKIDEMIDSMFLLREQKRGLESQVKEVKAKISNLEQDLLTRFNEVGTDYARGSMASASVTESLVPQIDDWGQVAEWIMENDGLYLVHRRVSSGPWKELRDAGTEVPGIEPYTKVAISLRRLGD
jgi:hypothetical protein